MVLFSVFNVYLIMCLIINGILANFQLSDKTLLNGDPQLSGEENEQIFKLPNFHRTLREIHSRSLILYYITMFISTDDKNPLLDSRLGVGLGWDSLGLAPEYSNADVILFSFFRLFFW